ncbi:MAG: 23S rRNA pseudouridine(1911/1915/1917) synthase RluD [Pseudomonadota bacterium]|nr:23S rRNA pseudouridine(1911/1915/1917) synthase RluD [Pseudomonadota bacterium]
MTREPDGKLTLALPVALAGSRFDQALARVLPQFSRSRLQTWIESGRVTVDGRSIDVRYKVKGGEDVVLRPAPDEHEQAYTAEAIALDIVHEDDTLLVIDKPAGLVVHPGSGNWQGTLLNALLHHAPHLAGVPRAGIVHRLDKDTTGLLVVAKTLEAQTALVRALQAHTVRREYAAVAAGDIAQDGTVDAPIGRHPTRRTHMAVVANGKPARTHYRVLERFGVATSIACRLETGRTHQIRVHLASLSHPLIGDPVYGKAQAVEFPRQALHAARLDLTHPASGRLCSWRSPLPEDLAGLLDSLRQRVQARAS